MISTQNLPTDSNKSIDLSKFGYINHYHILYIPEFDIYADLDNNADSVMYYKNNVIYEKKTGNYKRIKGGTTAIELRVVRIPLNHRHEIEYNYENDTLKL